MSDSGYTAAAPGDFFCPAGGTWYACQTGTKFVGCCASDPCKDGCFGDTLRPAGFSKAVYNVSPGGTCGGNTDFWTCMFGPTFWGCCNSDPCANNSTCALGDLEPAFMNRTDQFEYFGALNLLLSSTVSTIPSSTSISATTSSPPPSSDSTSSSKVSGAVIGGAVGGVLGLVAIIAAVVFFLCRRRRRKQNSGSIDVVPVTVTAEKDAERQGLAPHLGGQAPPPRYSYPHEPMSQEVQELPAEPVSTNRYSELPGQIAAHRLSELPSGAPQATELESPDVSPMPRQTQFASTTAEQPPQGLGLQGTGQSLKS